jgi:hypothetical protein
LSNSAPVAWALWEQRNKHGSVPAEGDTTDCTIITS